MAIFWAIIIGFIVGLIARFLMPGRDPAGFIITVLIGIAGAFIGTFLGRTLGWYASDQSAGFLASVIGAMILLFLYHMLFGRKEAATRV